MRGDLVVVRGDPVVAPQLLSAALTARGPPRGVSPAGILWLLARLRGSPGGHLRAGILRWSAGILWSYSTASKQADS